MTTNNKDWLTDIHDRMDEFEMDEPAGLWESIQSALPESVAPEQSVAEPVVAESVASEPVTSESAVKTFWLWPRRVAAVAAVVAGVVMTYTYLGRDSESQLLTDVPVAGGTSAGSGIAKTETTTNAATDAGHTTIAIDQLMAQNDKPASSSKAPSASSQTPVEPTSVSEENNAQTDKGQAKPETSDERAENSAAQEKKTITRRPTIGRSTIQNQLLAQTDRGHSQPMSVSLFTNGISGSRSNQRNLSTGYLTSVGTDGADWNDDPLLGIMLYNQGRETEVKMHHRLPLTVGANLQYRLDKHWSLETGAYYSYLSSDYTDGTESHYISGTQRLHYVGIPLGVKRDVYATKRFSLYASAGVSVAKCVSGEVDERYIVDHQEKQTEHASVDEHPVQFSAKASVGAQYDIADHCGIYVEPGLSYYFDDNSALKTIYKDKPLNFSLNLGLRFSIGR